MSKKPELAPQRLEPSPDLPEDQAAIWADVVGSMPAEHFVAAHRPLLEAYVAAAAKHRKAVRKDSGGPKSPWLRIMRECAATMASLATKLRLTPQHTVTPGRAATSTSRRQNEAETEGTTWRERLEDGSGLPN